MGTGACRDRIGAAAGDAPRLVARVPFNPAVPFLGMADMPGHPSIGGILLAIRLCGDEVGFAAPFRRETDTHPTAHVLPPLPEVACTLGPSSEWGVGE